MIYQLYLKTDGFYHLYLNQESVFSLHSDQLYRDLEALGLEDTYEDRLFAMQARYETHKENY